MKIGNKDLALKLQQALAGENEDAQVQAWEAFSNDIVETIKNDAIDYQASQDKNILAQRGYRQLTTAEDKYYEKFIQASKSRMPQQAFLTFESEKDAIMPETIIDEVFKELVDERPLLSKINFQNAKYATKMILNDHTAETAVWGKIDATITEEVNSAFKVIELTQNKLSAFAQIPLGILDLGKEYLDRYIRTVLKDALLAGLEKAIVVGDGNGCPVGLTRNLNDYHGSAYNEKSPIAITDFGVKEMGKALKVLTKSEKGRNRNLGKLTLLVNSADYYDLLAPCVRMMTNNGVYVNTFAFPVDVVISEYVPSKKAILADLSNYYLGMGFAKEGVLEYSDEFKFLDDLRVYRIKTYGMGRPFDNNVSVLLNITGLKPAVPTVAIAGEVTTRTAE